MKPLESITQETLELLKSYKNKPKKNIIRVIEQDITLNFT